MSELCPVCQARTDQAPLLAIRTNSRKGGMMLPVLSIVAVHAMDRGVTIYLADGSEYFEYLTLKNLMADYPGVFFAASRHWIVRMGQVASFESESEYHMLTLRDLDMQVPVSRRYWGRVSKMLDAKITEDSQWFRRPGTRSWTRGRVLERRTA